MKVRANPEEEIDEKSRRQKIQIKNLDPMFRVINPIYAIVHRSPYHDKRNKRAYAATYMDAGVSALGTSPGEAIQTLKQRIIKKFLEHEHEENLSVKTQALVCSIQRQHE